MNIKAIKLKKFLEKSDSLYKNIMITSLRARQIIDDRFQDFTIEEDIEDSDQLEELLEDVDYNVEKPISVATSEFMNNELDWRTPEENSDI
tara:strand:+ start:827 stop:1099 length:273 start_codon:yes stop_codon:yes gene_type:complete